MPVFTVRTSPSLPGTVLMTRPICNCPLGKQSATSSTRSPISAFRQGRCHFCLCCKPETYFLSHRFQKWSARTCACLHVLLAYLSSHTKTPGGKTWTALCSSRWLEVKGWQSFGSSDAVQSGLEFRIDSTWRLLILLHLLASHRVWPWWLYMCYVLVSPRLR